MQPSATVIGTAVAIASVAQIVTNVLILKGQRRIMATGQEILNAANAVKSGLAAAEARVDKLVADIANPNIADVTASDAAVAVLKGIASDLDAFHAPVAVITSPPTP